MNKKLTSVILSTIMICGSETVSPTFNLYKTTTTFAEDSETSGRCGVNAYWNFDESTGTLTISGTGEMFDYSSVGVPWNTHRYKIKSIIIEDEITNVGNSSFRGCDVATQIIISDSVTYIGSYSFSGCCKVEEITIPNNVIQIENGAFNSCSNLKNISLPSGIDKINDYLFNNCGNITEFLIPDSVSYIGINAFQNCYNLKNINIPNNVTTIREASFGNCSKLCSITIPKNVKKIGNDDSYNDTFYGCASGFSIYGYHETYAEEYANKHNIPFIPIDDSTYESSSTTSVTTTTATSSYTTNSNSTTTTTTTSCGTYTTTTTKGSSTTTTMQYKPEYIVKCDMSYDGQVTVADAVLLMKFVSEDSSVTLNSNVNPDIDSDGIVNVNDVIIVLNALKPFCINVGKEMCQAGDKVTIPIKVYNDKGTAGGQLYIDYDPRLIPVSIKAGDAYDMTFVSDYNSYPLYIGWTNKDGLNQTAKDGSVIAYIEFKVDNNMRDPEYLYINIAEKIGTNVTRIIDDHNYQHYVTFGTGYITVFD